MGRFTEALHQEAAAHDESVRAAIRWLDPDGLMKWCREFMDAPRTTWRVDPKRIILQSDSDEDLQAVVDLARKNADWHEAMIEVAKGLRKQGNAIPQPWRDHLSDLYLSIAKKPDRRGQPKPVQRDELICRCIGLIERHTPYTATINEGTDPETTCAVNIVAEALGDKPGRGRVLKIWKAHRKKILSDL